MCGEGGSAAFTMAAHESWEVVRGGGGGGGGGGGWGGGALIFDCWGCAALTITNLTTNLLIPTHKLTHTKGRDDGKRRGRRKGETHKHNGIKSGHAAVRGAEREKVNWGLM